MRIWKGFCEIKVIQMDLKNFAKGWNKVQKSAKMRKIDYFSGSIF